MNDITKELAETLKELRTKYDAKQHLGASMVRVDAVLDRYAEPFMTPEESKMKIDLKEYEGKLVVVTFRNEWMVVDLVNTNTGYDCYPYSIDNKNYSNDGQLLIGEEHPHDIVDIALADEDPVITRVEVITDKREYVNWNKDNVITTSLQDEGRTLKVFVTKNTEETMYPKQPKPINMVEIESKRWATALSGLIDKLGGDSPALWEWTGKIPTPEKVVECLQELVDFHMSIAADNELEECCKWLKGVRGTMKITGIDDPFLVSISLRNARRPTLKSQALKDFETVRKHSDLLPEILDTIENALKSIPDT